MNGKLNNNYVVPTFKHGCHSVMVWDCFGNNMTGYLLKRSGIFKKEAYLNISQKNEIPSGHRIISLLQ